jgi:MFS family permease
MAMGLWLTTVAGLAFGVIDVLVPLRLAHLGAPAVAIGAMFLGAAVVETVLSPVAGRLSDRRGAIVPVRISLAVGVVVSLGAPVLRPAALLIAFLIIGAPAFGTLFAPSSAVLSTGADRIGLHQGLAFGLTNFAWAGGQGIAAAASGAIAQATSDLVPYAVLAAVCAVTLVTLLVMRIPGMRAPAGAGHHAPACPPGRPGPPEPELDVMP